MIDNVKCVLLDLLKRRGKAVTLTSKEAQKKSGVSVLNQLL